jgi:multiple sugar transport system permease protein
MSLHSTGLAARVWIALTYIFLTAVVVIAVFPVLWVVLSSLKSELEMMAYPPRLLISPSMDAYKAVFAYPKGSGVYFWDFFRGSLVVGVSTAIGVLLISYPAAYGIARYRFWGRSGALYTILATRMVPPIAMLVPLYMFMSSLKLFDTYYALILTFTALQCPVATWILLGFVQSVSVEMEEAARIDGCNNAQVILLVLVPLTTQGIAVVSFLSFLLAWNDFAMSSVLTAIDTRTLTLLAMMFISFTEDASMITQMCAVATLVIIPPIIYIFSAQRYLRSGLTLGSLKE